jgi:hypothetical protein
MWILPVRQPVVSELPSGMRPGLLLTFALTACGNQPAPEPDDVAIPGDLTLKAGEERTVQGLTVTFVGVKEDSRCPEDVQCVWAGNAAVELRMEGGPDTLAVTLNSGTDPRSIGVQGLRFTFKSLLPAPKAGAAAPASPELTLHVESTR